MALDEGLLARIRDVLSARDDMLPEMVVEKKMFGGLSFMVQGNFTCGVTNKAKLAVRVGKEKYEEALAHPQTSPMDFTGRPMKGWVYVEPAGLEEDQSLAYWVEQGVRYALSLPAK